MPPKRNIVDISRKRKAPDNSDLDSSDDLDFDPDNPNESETKLDGLLLECLLKKADVSDEEHKSKTLDTWMSKFHYIGGVKYDLPLRKFMTVFHQYHLNQMY